MNGTMDSVKKIMITPTEDGLIQLFRTAFAGLLSFFLDAGLLYILTEGGLYYLISVAVTYIISFFFNFALVRTFVFPRCKKSLGEELLSYAGIAAVGLPLTELCMYLLTERVGVFYIVSKFLAAVVVMLWSFSARKFWLYRQ
jgi:putative flippase GtrA